MGDPLTKLSEQKDAMDLIVYAVIGVAFAFTVGVSIMFLYLAFVAD